MPIKNFASRLALSLAVCGTAMGQKVNGADYNKPDGGPPAKFFQASSSIPVAAIQAAAAKASKVPSAATYPIGQGSTKSTIHSDWADFAEANNIQHLHDQGASFSFVADMDVDCDGLNHGCKGNPDGQDETNWGALSAYEVPFIVIPQKFLDANKSKLKGNAVSAVICNGKMFYGIFGDSNGDSLRTCFPEEDLNGNKGHTAADVTYIVFTGDNAVLPSSALNKNYITNFDTLRSMGDSLVGALAKNLNLGGGGGNPPTTLTTTSLPEPTGGSCSWPGHCAGEDNNSPPDSFSSGEEGQQDKEEE
ncbi:fungal chitosanase [Aspergillus nomiae NRRL 13137]|uniref:Endo-chitosanase n=1 Tax=Aspergillus nomiae NRRL (strain ATCC 15546 / NRRL 13137 / CBS 260.88 / M93) TaxID=1509407 RepID=A0A0L1J6Q5_ASPN3|nr:fungal chitosanase [Aspergillus nomiae NRRL 13137]KNG87365.1 fungal chitosanase [Aspergillus nomiae NRRL 13137]